MSFSHLEEVSGLDSESGAAEGGGGEGSGEGSGRELPLTLLSPLTPPYEYALMSSAVYVDLDTEEGCSNPHHRQLIEKGWALAKDSDDREMFVKSRDGYRGAVYVHEGRKEICIAHRGSQNVGSWITDLKIIVKGERGPQMIDAVARTLTESIREKARRGYRVMVTGHSLGGFLATMTVYICSRPGYGYYVPTIGAVTFDAAGSREMMEDPQPKDRVHQVNIDGLHIVNFLSHPDVVTAFNHHAGSIFWLNRPELERGGVYDLTKLGATHSLDGMLAAFDEETGYPNTGVCIAMEDWPHIKPKENALKIKRVIDLIRGNPSVLGAVGAIESLIVGAYGLYQYWFEEAEVAEGAEHVDAREAARELDALLQSRFIPLKKEEPYDQVMHLRHVPREIGEFLVAYQEYKDIATIAASFAAEFKLTAETRDALQHYRIDAGRVRYIGRNVFDFINTLSSLSHQEFAGIRLLDFSGYCQRYISIQLARIDSLHAAEAEDGKAREDVAEIKRELAELKKRRESATRAKLSYLPTVVRGKDAIVFESTVGAAAAKERSEHSLRALDKLIAAGVDGDVMSTTVEKDGTMLRQTTDTDESASLVIAAQTEALLRIRAAQSARRSAEEERHPESGK